MGLAVALFVLSSGWLVEQTAARPSLWFVAALTFPLVFRRRAPMAVFLVVSASRSPSGWWRSQEWPTPPC